MQRSRSLDPRRCAGDEHSATVKIDLGPRHNSRSNQQGENHFCAIFSRPSKALRAGAVAH
jgi:hypothetical protein